MYIRISEPITLDEVTPLVNHLCDIEREELRHYLERQPRLDWKTEWEKTVAHFQQRFVQFPETEVEADLTRAGTPRAKRSACHSRHCARLQLEDRAVCEVTDAVQRGQSREEMAGQRFSLAQRGGGD